MSGTQLNGEPLDCEFSDQEISLGRGSLEKTEDAGNAADQECGAGVGSESNTTDFVNDDAGCCDGEQSEGETSNDANAPLVLNSDIAHSEDASESESAQTGLQSLTMESPVSVEHETEDENADNDDDNDDDDFGSFDEASFEEFQAEEPPLPRPSLKDSIEPVLDTIFCKVTLAPAAGSGELLSENAQEYLDNLSRPPRLNPPNWVKSNLRHSLLLKLGIPINLDELERPLNYAMPQRKHSRKKSVSEQDIDWTNFVIPDAESLDLSAEKQQQVLSDTDELLSSIERANMTNTSEAYLQSCAPDVLDAKLSEMKHNYEQLITLSSLWREQLKELRSSQEIYEAVVQDYVGHKQKVQRNEMLEGLCRSKTKKGKKTF